MFDFYLITWRKFYGYTENAARLRLYKINKKFLGHISFRSENDTDDGSTRCQFFFIETDAWYFTFHQNFTFYSLNP